MTAKRRWSIINKHTALSALQLEADLLTQAFIQGSSSVYYKVTELDELLLCEIETQRSLLITLQFFFAIDILSKTEMTDSFVLLLFISFIYVIYESHYSSQ